MKKQIFLLILCAAYFIGSFLISCNNTANPPRQFTRHFNVTVDTIIDQNSNGMHDPSCCCKDCLEDYSELNYYRIAIDGNTKDIKLYLVDNYTRDTIADLSDNEELLNIIIKDNQ